MASSISSVNEPRFDARLPPASEAEQLAAAAEVDVMEGPARQRDLAQQQALMGATGDADGVAGFEVHDESGELVRERFLQFLTSL